MQQTPKRSPSFATFYLMTVIAISIGFVAGALTENSIQHNHAIKAGCAAYNATTGDFEWSPPHTVTGD